MVNGGKLLIKLVLLVLLLSITTTLALADGCCIPTQKGAGETSAVTTCLNEGEMIDDVVPQPMSEDLCTETWSDQNCDHADNQAACMIGCCCEESPYSSQNSGIYTSRNACAADALEFTTDIGADACSAHCNQDFSTYTISGTVYDEDGVTPAVGIRVELDQESIYTLTDDNGDYSFTNVPPGERLLYAFYINPEELLCDDQRALSLSADAPGQDLTLECEEDDNPPETCRPVWDCHYTPDDPDRCNDYYDECIDINPDTECPKETWTGPLPFFPCPHVGDECSPNDGLDTDGEEACDYTAPDGVIQFRDDPDLSCADFGYVDGPLDCRECRIVTSGCDVCPTDPNACSQAQCEHCPACADSPYCDFNVCEEEQPTDLLANTIRGRAAAEVEWRFDPFCLAEVEAFTVQICSDTVNDEVCTGTTDTVIIERGIGDGDDVFANIPHRYLYDADGTGLEENTEYCFIIEANMNENGNPLTTTTAPLHACIFTGDAPCMEQCDGLDAAECAEAVTGSFCASEVNNLASYDLDMEYDNGILRCDQNNKLYVFEDCGELICDANGGNAVCLNEQDCEYCNALFGLYGYYHLDNKELIVPYFNMDDGVYDANYCSAEDIFQYHPINGAPPPACYYEKTPTVANRLDACEDVTSCYDYKNQISCEEGICGKNLDCAWRHLEDDWGNSLSDQFGLGVCVPRQSDLDDIDCERCDGDNGILPSCTDKLCSAHGLLSGAGCFLTEDNGCKTDTEITCGDYSNEQDCGTNPVAVDVDYLDSSDERNGGMHTLTPSNDLLALGGCSWVQAGMGYRCIKNTDGYKGPLATSYKDDCSSTDKDDYPYCGKDFEPPVTNISIFTAAEQNEKQAWHSEPSPIYSLSRPFGYVATDNLFPNSALDTWFGIGTTMTYPTISWADLLSQDIEGPVVISYYSKDPAENLEPVKSFDVILDNTPPTFVEGAYALSNYSYMIGDGTGNDWRTDLNITYTFTDEHDPIRCDGKLILDGTVFAGDRIITFDSQTAVTHRYNTLQDGVYTFSMDCSDHPFLDNRHEQPTTKTIVIEADSRITNPNPRRERLSVQDVMISVETQSEATCYFSGTTQFPYSEGGEEFDTADGIHHSKQLTGLGHGLYYYHVGCVFTDGVIVEANPSDSILFSVDLQPPTARLINQDTGEPYAPTSYSDSVDLELECVDDDPALQLTYYDANSGEIVTIWDGNSGSEDPGTDMTWCFNQGGGQCSDPYELSDWTPTITDEDVQNGNYLSYSCGDPLDNVETNYLPVYVKNLDVSLNEVLVCISGDVCYEPTGPQVTP